jgi:hypothetical protein
MELNKNVDFVLHNSGTIPNNNGILYSSHDDSFAKEGFGCKSSLINRENNGELHASSSPKNNNCVIEIYRFKFTEEIMEKLGEFSKIHQLDSRKDFKDSWNYWMEEHSLLIEVEVNRLKELGFKGDIVDKMFKSARYYFRKRKDKDKDMDNILKQDLDQEPEQKQDIKNRKYQCVSKLLLEIMDNHIKHLLGLQESIKKPSIAFLDFCKQNKELLKEEIQDLLQLGITDIKDIQLKIKKTYKNKYFSIIHK